MDPSADKPTKVDRLVSASVTFKRKFNAVCDAIVQLQGWAKNDRVVAGSGLLESQTPTGRLFDLDNAALPTAPCPLGGSLVTVSGTQYVQFQWGLINGQQPAGFAAGNTPPFQLAAASGNYYYASAVYDPSTALWGSPQVSIQSAGVANTTTTAYQLLCSVGEDSDSNLVISATCGDAWFSPCDLAVPS